MKIIFKPLFGLLLGLAFNSYAQSQLDFCCYDVANKSDAEIARLLAETGKETPERRQYKLIMQRLEHEQKRLQYDKSNYFKDKFTSSRTDSTRRKLWEWLKNETRFKIDTVSTIVSGTQVEADIMVSSIRENVKRFRSKVFQPLRYSIVGKPKLIHVCLLNFRSYPQNENYVYKTIVGFKYRFDFSFIGQEPYIRLRNKGWLKMPGRGHDMMKEELAMHDFYNWIWQETVKSNMPRYNAQTNKGAAVVIDKASRLMWQRSGSVSKLSYSSTKEYLKKMNTEKFAGFDDWRLPTSDEAISLMQPNTKMDSAVENTFDKAQSSIWTSDTYTYKTFRNAGWIIDFVKKAGYPSSDDLCFVRAVRSSSKGF